MLLIDLFMDLLYSFIMLDESQYSEMLNHKSINTTVSMPGWLYVKLTRMAKEYNRSISQIMRIALTEFIEREEEAVTKISKG